MLLSDVKLRFDWRRSCLIVDECSHVEFQFTHIDSDEPDKLFGLAMKIRPDKSFSGL